MIATVDEATGADSSTLFTQENAKLLCPATSLLAATIACAPLNAHELQRVGGIESIVALFRRCISMLTLTSDATALPYLVAMPLVRTLAAVAPSADSTARLSDEANIGALDDLVRCLHLEQLPNLAEAAFEAVAALCIHPPCQQRLAAAGAAWFGYSTLTRYYFTDIHTYIRTCIHAEQVRLHPR